MQHLEEGTIHAWLDGALSVDEQATVEQHVQQCPECAALVAEARGMIAGAARIVGALDVVPGGVIPKQRGAAGGSGSVWRSLRLTPFRAAMAASLMIAAASLAVFRRGGSDASLDRMESRSAMSAAAPAASPAPAATERLSRAMDSIAPVQPPAGNAARDQAVDGSRRAAEMAQGRTDSAMRKAAGAPSPSTPTVAKREVAAAAAPPPTVSPRVANEAPQAARQAQAGAAGGIAAADAATRGTRDSMSVAGRQRSVALESMVSKAVSPTQFLMTSGTEPGTFIGCYDVPADSGALRGALPERFALERLPGNPPRNVVYAIDSARRLNPTVVGTWREVDRSSFMLTLTSGGQRDSLLADAAVVRRTELRASNTSRPLRVLRTGCPR